MKRCGLARCAAADQFTEAKHHGVRDAVKDAISRALAANQPGIEQDLQVLRDVWLIAIQIIYDLINRHRATLQGTQDPKTARFTQDLKSARDQIDDFFVDRCHSIRPK